MEEDAAGKVFMEYFERYCPSPNSPIPNFYTLLRENRNIRFTSEGRISDDFTFFPIDAKQEKYLPNDQLSLGIGFPHGKC
ncbi:hypothetical protein [Gaoshiqia sp. Z1-71]|uniref:hypothetical protein n=1 Tax=Gaoshiqia hydrogeniformans TaxID=3290090 RepID=UPI003BF8AE1D